MTTHSLAPLVVLLTARSLTVALALTLTAEPALGQLGMRRALVVNPPGSAALGARVTLSVQGAPRGGSYRFVAFMTATGGGDRPGSVKGCPINQSIGTGTSVTWQPISGTYRLTAYGPDTLSLTYAVRPRSAMLASSQTPAQPSGVTLVLRTDDLGPGHTYSWWMRYSYVTGDGNQKHAASSQPWMAQTNGPLAAYPTPIPQQATISAKVSIYRANTCEVVAAGTKP